MQLFSLSVVYCLVSTRAFLFLLGFNVILHVAQQCICLGNPAAEAVKTFHIELLLSVIRHILSAVILTAELGIKSYRLRDSSLSITVLRTKLKSTQAPWRQSDHSIQLTTFLHQALKLRMYVASLPQLPHTFIVQCLGQWVLHLRFILAIC